MQTTYTGQTSMCRDGCDHVAEVTVRARPRDGPSEVLLSATVLEHLREVFESNFEHHRHCVWAAVAVVLAHAEDAEGMPHLSTSTFLAEVIDVRVSGDAGRELSGFLLSVAGMHAIADWLEAWEDEQRKFS